METWKPVVGYEQRYEVSSLGLLRSMNWKRTGQTKPLVASPDSHGYLSVTLYGNGSRRSFGIHQLVAEAFIGRKPSGLHTNHKDGNRLNNSFGNLEYVTQGENTRHAFRLGLMNISRGEKVGTSKLTFKKVAAIKSLRSAGAKVKDLAAMMGVSRAAIGRVLNGSTWHQCQKVG